MKWLDAKNNYIIWYSRIKVIHKTFIGLTEWMRVQELPTPSSRCVFSSEEISAGATSSLASLFSYPDSAVFPFWRDVSSWLEFFILKKTQMSGGGGVNFTCKFICMEKDSTPDGHTFPERAGEAAQPWHISCWRCPPCCWAGARWHRSGLTPESSSLPALWTSSRVRSYSRWQQCPDGGK